MNIQDKQCKFLIKNSSAEPRYYINTKDNFLKSDHASQRLHYTRKHELEYSDFSVHSTVSHTELFTCIQFRQSPLLSTSVVCKQSSTGLPI